MKIETQFEVNDEVYCIIESGWDNINNTLDRGSYIIQSVEVRVLADRETKEVTTYVSYYVRPKLYPSMSCRLVKEDYMFTSYKEAKLAFVNK